MSGDDWADASVDHLKVLDDCNLELALAEYKEWLRAVYHPARKACYAARRAHRRLPPRVAFLRFAGFLVDRGNAVFDSEIEEFEDN